MTRIRSSVAFAAALADNEVGEVGEGRAWVSKYCARSCTSTANSCCSHLTEQSHTRPVFLRTDRGSGIGARTASPFCSLTVMNFSDSIVQLANEIASCLMPIAVT